MRNLLRMGALAALVLLLGSIGLGIEVAYAVSTLRWALEGGTELDVDV